MNLPRLTTNLNNITNLSDEPNSIDGLTSSQLKQKFDKAGNDIKDYLNNTLLPGIENSMEDTDGQVLENAILNNPNITNPIFDNPLSVRNSLQIYVVTTIPSNVNNGDIYLVYKE